MVGQSAGCRLVAPLFAKFIGRNLGRSLGAEHAQVGDLINPSRWRILWRLISSPSADQPDVRADRGAEVS